MHKLVKMVIKIQSNYRIKLLEIKDDIGNKIWQIHWENRMYLCLVVS